MKVPAVITLVMSGAWSVAGFQFSLGSRNIVSTPSRSALVMSSSPATGTGPGLQYNPEKYQDEKNKKNFRKLSDALEVLLFCACTMVRASHHVPYFGGP